MTPTTASTAPDEDDTEMLPPTTRRVAQLLRRVRRGTSIQLGDRLGIHECTVRKAVRHLRALGWCVRVNRHGYLLVSDRIGGTH